MTEIVEFLLVAALILWLRMLWRFAHWFGRSKQNIAVRQAKHWKEGGQNYPLYDSDNPFYP